MGDAVQGRVFPLQNPPNFLRASALSEHISPVVVIPAEASSPDSEPVLEKDDLVDMDASQQVRSASLEPEGGGVGAQQVACPRGGPSSCPMHTGERTREALAKTL